MIHTSMSVKSGLLTCIILSFLFTGCRHITTNDESFLIKEKENTINNLDSLSEVLRIQDVTKALKYAREAVKLSNDYSLTDELSKSYLALGNAYRNSYPDSSYFYYLSSLKLTQNRPWNKNICAVYYSLANLYIESFDNKNAICALDTCIRLAEKEKVYDVLSDAYTVLGMIYFNINDSCMAFKMYSHAFEIAKKNNLTKQSGISIGNLSMFQKNENQIQAMQKKALEYLQKVPGAKYELCTLLNDIGLRQTNTDSAIRYLRMSYDQARQGNLKENMIGAANNLAYYYLDKNMVEKAVSLIRDTAIPMAQQINQLEWLSVLYDTYSDILKSRHQWNSAYTVLKESIDYKNRYDVRKKEGQTRLLMTMLEMKNKELTIAEQKSELKSRKSQNGFLLVMLILSVMLILVSLAALIIFRQKSAIKLKRQQIDSALKIIELEEYENNRLGFELHDNIGYLVRVLDGYIKALNIKEKDIKLNIIEKLNDLGTKITTLTNRVRLIKDDNNNLNDLISDIVNDMINLTGIDVVYFIPAHMPKIKREAMIHICRITQELLTNADKYAHDATIHLDIAFAGDILLLSYRDTGPGFDPDLIENRCIGLHSIKERVNLIGGDSELKTAPGMGTQWEITVPLTKYLRNF
ncbi:MAG: hypothetical protein Q8867_00885 [Bacteroidota bacterium]|nr:hypothetical protein [Bacteroidota bacterium]